MPTLRKRLLVDEWVIIAPRRAERPRQLGLSLADEESEFCPFCPAHQAVTPPTIESWKIDTDETPWSVRAIPNKFPALMVEETLDRPSDPLYQQMGGVGAHEVIIESPRHDTDWRQLSTRQIEQILIAWRARMRDLRQDRRLRCAMIFKNHGARAGATLAHIHSQLIALPRVPSRLRMELDGADQYYDTHQCCALCAMMDRERHDSGRIIVENDGATAVAPYGSRVPFETWILPRTHGGDFMACSDTVLAEVAAVIEELLPLWERALGAVAYNLVLHSLPFDLVDEPYYHWHLELLPRIGQVAGFEWGSDIYINSTPSETAAKHLRHLNAQS